MNKLTSFTDRFITALVGLILVTLGMVLPAIYASGGSDLSSFSELLEYWDAQSWVEQSWWNPAMGGIAVLLVIIAVLIIRINRASTPSRQYIGSTSSDAGTISVALPPLASAIAEEFRGFPKVRKARCHLVEEHNVTLFDLTVISSPTTELLPLIERTDNCVAELDATTEHSGITLRTFLQFDLYRPEHR